MRKLTAVVAILLCTAALAETRERTQSGVFVSDDAGRVTRLEGDDGVTVQYLYADATSEQTTGIAIKVNKLTLTVRFDNEGNVAAEGMPALTSLLDHRGRPTAVHAGDKAIARFDYAPSGLFSGVALPGRLTWNVSAPDAAHRVLQSIADQSGTVVASALVTSGFDANEIESRTWYDVAASEFGLPVQSLRYDSSATGALTTVRANGRVAFYVVHTGRCDVGFAPNGTPRFYDLALNVYSGDIPAGSDLIASPAWDAQRLTVPDHLVWSIGGATGLYIESGADASILNAWSDAKGRLHTIKAQPQTVSTASR